MNVKTNFLKKAKLGRKLRIGEVWPNMKAAWENIVDSASEDEYNSSVNTFKERYGHWPKFTEYVDSTVLGPIKEKFVRYEPNESCILVIPPQTGPSQLMTD
jgi:hypothetical protein